MMLTVPLIFGSTTKLRPVISLTAFTTASMSALTKLRVTVSSAAAAGKATTSATTRLATRRTTHAILRCNMRIGRGGPAAPDFLAKAAAAGVACRFVAYSGNIRAVRPGVTMISRRR